MDVRDVALAHVRAIEVPEAGGNRFITSGGAFILQDFSEFFFLLKKCTLDPNIKIIVT